MKKKALSIFFVTMLTVSSLFTFTGCQNSNIEEPKKEVKVEHKNDDTKVIVKKIKGIDKLAIVKDSKNVDLDKFVGEMVKDSEEIKKVVLDTSKVDIKKCGQYKVDVTVFEKEEKTNDKINNNTTDSTKETDEKPSELEKDDSELKGSVKVEVVDKKDVETKLKDNKIIIGDDNKELKEDVKESEEPKEEKTKKEEETKKEDSKKEDTSSKGNKKDKANKNKGTSSSSSNSGGSSKPKPEPKPEPTPAPEPKPEPKPVPEPKPEPKPEPTPAPEPEPYWVEEVGHWEKVMIEEAIEVPKHEDVIICNVCNQPIYDADPWVHLDTHGEDFVKGYRTGRIQVGTQILPPIYEDRWVVDVPGHWEYK